MEKSSPKKKAASKKKVVKKASVKKASVKKAASKKAMRKNAPSKKAASKQSSVSYQQRYQMIAEAAYLIAEKQDFTPGNEIDNWLQAEQQIDDWITEQGITLVE